MCVLNNSSEMSAHDCFELGRQMCVTEDYIHAAEWFQAALERLGTDMKGSELHANILEYWAFSAYKNGKSLFKRMIKFAQKNQVLFFFS